MAVVVIAAIAGAVFLRMDSGEESGTTSAAWLPVEHTGQAVQEFEPLAGGTIRVGVASVRIFPGTFPETVRVSASLATNGALDVRVEPPLDLALPARITLPLPPGAGWGDDPRLWPVVVATGGGEPLILQPNTVDLASLSVDVPHFSTFVPAVWKDAANLLVKLGKILSAPPATPKSPGGIDVGMSLPKDYNTDATIGQVSITVQATTGGPKPETPPAGATLPAEWKQFEGVNVVVSGFRRPASNQPLQEVVLANEPLWQGGRRTLDVTLPGGGLWEEANAGQAVLVFKLIKGGKTILEKTVPTPIGGYWASFACAEGKDTAQSNAWGRFTVYYLKDPSQGGYPDKNYHAGTPAPYTGRDGGKLSAAPARVLDACSALSAAYNAFNSAAYFSDPANAPSDEMDVWMQNWDTNNASAVTNHIVLSVDEFEPQDFRVNAAHELAHRFQHQYSIGLFRSGGWLHEASAEYLAQRVFLPAGESNQTMKQFFGGNPAWVNNGLFSSQEADNYSAASFLAYLADVHGINIARDVWVEGGSGSANLSGWESHLDALIKRHVPASSLSEAWGTFMNAYLVDSKSWGDWAGVVPWVALTDLEFDASKSSTLFRSARSGTPNFSGSGVTFKVVNSAAVTIGMHITAFPAERAMAGESSWYGLAAGDAADGTVTPITLAFVQGKADYQGSFRLGTGKDALGPGPKARVMHVYRGSTKGGYNWIRYDAWALPQLTGVEFDDKTGNLTWPKSPVEGLVDADKRGLFDQYELVARSKDRPDEWVVIEEIAGGKDTYEIVVDPAVVAAKAAGPDVCVRLKDAFGNTSPEGCPQQGDLIFRLTSWQATGDQRVAAHLLGAGRKPNPSPTVICQSDPSKCFFAVLPVSLPTGPTAGGGAIPFICTEAGLTLLKRLAYADALREGSCQLVGGLTQPAGSGDNEGIPEMTYSLTPSKVQAAMGSTYGMGPGYQYNVTAWAELEAVFADGRVTGTIKLTDYSEYKSDGVRVVGGYNPNGAIPLWPPQFATITFEGTLAK